MEHGSVTDSTASTFSIMEEDHTLANSVRFVLNQEFCDVDDVDFTRLWLPLEVQWKLVIL
ncbi:hypothetical protein E2562_021671 [Oryza meyeriana var. granulata]|uniref:DNA-directed RNA polymerase RBP11-like dimerisation domain-containing protein n=1 Tax=Oryza meyeriana var. granulata TaxID=110450 RepID=A0A6G1DYJ5_9ORYZ|nr:hypothetical protein E2562_021671 [Oryza meyeriana var. granulata]